MCVPLEALLSGLLLMIRRDGYRATAKDLRALIDAGIPETQIAEALSRIDDEPHRHARAVLQSLKGPAPG